MEKNFFFDAKLRFALIASFWYGNNEPKRSEANQKISKKREANIRVKIKLFGTSTRSFAIAVLAYIFDSPRFASGH